MAGQDKQEDVQWDEMLRDAVVFQQSIYEQIPDWTIFSSDDLDSLRNYTLIAICGVPYSEEIHDLPDAQMQQIDGLVKILETKAKTPTNEYCFGIIYVVIFRCRNVENVSTANRSTSCIPIFKIRTYTDENNFNTSYIDPNCRVYNSWDDFLNNNKLPSCTMAYPHDGYYQPNPDFEIREDYSDVWVSYRDSPAATNSFTNTAILLSVLGVASGVGTIASCVGRVARAAFNTVVAEEIPFHGVGIGLQVFDIHREYQENNSVNYISVTHLVTSAFFFGNAVMNAQTAAGIITSTQNTILESYKQSLSTKRFRKSFKRMRQKCLKRADSEAAARNEIVRRIRNVTTTNDLLLNLPTVTVPKSLSVNVYFDKSVLIVNGIELVDIVLFMKSYVKPIVLDCGRQLLLKYANLYNQTNSEQQEIFSQLMQLFETLFFENSSRTSSYAAPRRNPVLLSRFRRIINDMQNLQVSVDILPTLFNIANNLLDVYKNGSVDMLVCEVIEELWHYLITCVENYLQCTTTELRDDNLREIVLKIINALAAGLHIMKENLIRAFRDSMRH